MFTLCGKTGLEWFGREWGLVLLPDSVNKTPFPTEPF